MCFLDSLGFLIVEISIRSYFDSFNDFLFTFFFLFFITVITAFYCIQVAIVDLRLFLKSAEEDVLYAFLSEVLVPVLDQFRTQVVGLVYKQDELLPFAHFTDVLLQICRVEEVGIPRVHDLKNIIYD